MLRSSIISATMAARPNLIPLDRRVPLFLCRFCETHIAISSHHMLMETTYHRGIFREAVNVGTVKCVCSVNVNTDCDCNYRREGTNIVTDVRCSSCNHILGIKFIHVENNEDIYVREGRFRLDMINLHFSYGLLVYHSNPHLPLFYCHLCGMHVALHSNCIHMDNINGTAIFLNAVNVQLNGRTFYRPEGSNIIVDVFCSGCSNWLGIKFMLVPNSTGLAVEGRFRLQIMKLRLLDGNLLQNCPIGYN